MEKSVTAIEEHDCNDNCTRPHAGNVVSINRKWAVSGSTETEIDLIPPLPPERNRKLDDKARHMALGTLRDRHRDEYEEILAEARSSLGLNFRGSCKTCVQRGWQDHPVPCTE